MSDHPQPRNGNGEHHDEHDQETARYVREEIVQEALEQLGSHLRKTEQLQDEVKRLDGRLTEALTKLDEAKADSRAARAAAESAMAKVQELLDALRAPGGLLDTTKRSD